MSMHALILRGSLAALALLAAPAVHAGVCDARFMHDGGRLVLAGSGIVKVSADLTFSSVSKRGKEDCSALVSGTATYALAGLPGGKSTLDHGMAVKGGRATFERRGDAGASPRGGFDPRLLGVFGYGVPITKEGQTLPAETIRLEVGDRGPEGKVGVTPTVVRLGEKTVGRKQRIETAAAGSQECWPVSYARDTDATQASIQGLVLPIPAMRSTVTDWFCPALNMVLRQDIVQSGQKAVIEVTEVR
ncbi:putative membrane protein [plant metagenome]|uniref:Putative membrane protein n=1 Tax=plant metagenome TaxID=1297885 RepID=A0A484VHD5_9ZZZZ